jgi:hypothetical protein
VKARNSGRRLWIAAVALPALAVANILIFDALHSMMPYETWVHGQPGRPERSIPGAKP